MFKRVAVTLALVVFGLFVALGSSVVAQTNRSVVVPTTTSQVSGQVRVLPEKSHPIARRC